MLHNGFQGFSPLPPLTAAASHFLVSLSVPRAEYSGLCWIIRGLDMFIKKVRRASSYLFLFQRARTGDHGMKSQQRASTSALPSQAAFVQPLSSRPLSPVTRAHRGAELHCPLELTLARRTWPVPSLAVNPAAREGAALLNPLGKGGGSGGGERGDRILQEQLSSEIAMSYDVRSNVRLAVGWGALSLL